ncbi:hypothetical protein [Pontibacter harenae]|uniref:hypothetical protein n=1 Tax=Pontibacter harenae TaxID=2894083 RepID=UPI001E4CE36D|nr:hypothetical protein [Pontibacter harenae]MCC9165752.1 hypothetical protein [Pontibacter harenae]
MADMKKEFELEGMPRQNVYQVPDGYFDRLPMHIMERTAAKQAPESVLQPHLWKMMRPLFAPLVLLLVFAGVYFFNVASEPQPPVANFASLHEAEIMDYLDDHAKLETADFAELTSFAGPELAAEFLNVSSIAAEEELEYYRLDDLTY